jgi:hypothetical protein
MSKFLSLLAGAALFGGVSVANAAEPLTSAQMDTVVAGYYNSAWADAYALALGPNTYTQTSTEAYAVHGVASESISSSFAEAY